MPYVESVHTIPKLNKKFSDLVVVKIGKEKFTHLFDHVGSLFTRKYL